MVEIAKPAAAGGLAAEPRPGDFQPEGWRGWRTWLPGRLGALGFGRGRRHTAADDLPPPPDHGATREADPFAFQAAHRRLAWQFRISSMINVGLLAAILVQAAAISALVPLKEVRPALLRVEAEDNRLYRVEPITRAVPGFDLVMEQMARRYVRLVLEIDAVSQADRFREAWRYTDQALYQRFKSERFAEVERAIGSGLNRSIVIEGAERVSERAGVSHWAVDFVQSDERGGKAAGTRKLRAYLAMTTRPHTVTETEKFDNPLGIRVLDLSLKDRGTQ